MTDDRWLSQTEFFCNARRWWQVQNSGDRLRHSSFEGTGLPRHLFFYWSLSWVSHHIIMTRCWPLFTLHGSGGLWTHTQCLKFEVGAQSLRPFRFNWITLFVDYTVSSILKIKNCVLNLVAQVISLADQFIIQLLLYKIIIVKLTKPTNTSIQLLKIYFIRK